MTSPEKVRVLVVGDSGVGKTSLTCLIARDTCISSPAWTVGCSVEVKLHQYLEGTQHEKEHSDTNFFRISNLLQAFQREINISG